MSLSTNEIDIMLGKQIRAFRKKMRWGLKFLAYKLDVSIQQLQKYEMGINRISASLLYSMAQEFDTSIQCFFEEIDNAMKKRQEAKANYECGFNVLLIEDNLDDEFLIRDVISDFPQKMNLYAIRESTKALEFFRELSSKSFRDKAKPDIVLVELHMPKVSGIDILRNIKNDKFFHSTPVVLFASNKSTTDPNVLYNLNACGLIVKSCSAEEFRRQIYDTLSYWSQVVTLPKH